MDHFRPGEVRGGGEEEKKKREVKREEKGRDQGGKGKVAKTGIQPPHP